MNVHLQQALGLASAGLVVVALVGNGQLRIGRMVRYLVGVLCFAVLTSALLPVRSELGAACLFSILTIGATTTLATYIDNLSGVGLALLAGLGVLGAAAAAQTIGALEGIHPDALINVPDEIAAGDLGRVSSSVLTWMAVVHFVAALANVLTGYVARGLGDSRAVAKLLKEPVPLADEERARLTATYEANATDELEAVLADADSYRPEVLEIVRAIRDQRTGDESDDA